MLRQKINFTKTFPASILLISKLYAIALCLFSFFRIILCLTEKERFGSPSWSDVIQAFVMGIRFDIVISGYILLVPFVLISIISFITSPPHRFVTTIKWFIILLFSVAFMVCAADLPYFNQFFTRFNIMAFAWIDNPLFVLGMIIQEPRYWISSVPFVICCFIFYKVTNLFFKNHITQTPLTFKNISLSILFAGLIFLGIRGRLDEKTPINVGTAYFSENAFLNQLGLNPNFTLIRSYIESKRDENKPIQLIPDTEALDFVKQQLHIQSNDSVNPLARIITPNSITPRKKNVVLIIMESMSAAKMKRHGNTHNLTPFLDSLSHRGLYFENTYTAGIHTFNGVFSTLFSYPALFKKHSMKSSIISKYDGIATTLKQNGYSTTYFTTHDGQFDNVEGFLNANDFDRIISKSDYPFSEIKSTLGVPDDYMFRHAIPIINELHKNEKPFFVTFMTSSDHGPYYIPTYFNPKNKTDIKKQIVEYADFSLRKFINTAKHQNWFNNTIFVFIADHGAAMDVTYDISLDYNHSPLLFYAPKHISIKTSSNMAGQIDVYPTLMGLLQLPYTNNTLGIDLLKDKRPYIFFGSDDHYGVIDREWFLLVRKNRINSLYQYRTKNTFDFAKKNPEIVTKMKYYADANLQSYQYVLDKK